MSVPLVVTNVNPLKVDIWSDIACPWCYIGKRRFEQALAEHDGEVEVEYHSFELAPDTPVDFEGSEIDFLVGHKRMPAEQVRQMLDQVATVAAEVGLEYNFDTLRHTKTLTAHEALHHAKSLGRQQDLVERLFRAYFTEGRHVGRVDDVLDLAEEVGLDRTTLAAALEHGTHRAAVEADIEQARAYGINGVPFFVFDGRLGVSGAQPSEVFSDVLKRAEKERDS